MARMPVVGCQSRGVGGLGGCPAERIQLGRAFANSGVANARLHSNRAIIYGQRTVSVSISLSAMVLILVGRATPGGPYSTIGTGKESYFLNLQGFSAT
jgi:hypothetical protein